MTGGDLLIAAAVDAAVGDPRWLPHPVRGMGLAISCCEERIRLFCKSSMSLRVAGLCLAIGLPVVVYVIGSFVIEQAESISALCGQAAGIALASTTLAWRDLWNHAMTVTRELAGRNIPGARQAVGMIVGRDTASLSEAEIVRATVETIAESAADGVIAPLVYLTLGGAPLALAYKAINTLDSMIGHRDERYADFGPTFAHQKLTEDHQLDLSVETVRHLMIQEGLWHPKHAKHPVLHPLRERRARFGELVQIDGSPYTWFEDRAPACVLLVFIDDATGRLGELLFVKAETTFSYFEAMEHYLRRWGKPLALYSDKLSVFRVNLPNDLSGQGTTQFTRAMHQLQIEVLYAHSPQAKGRVERVNQTLQDRLVKELRLRGISSREAGNAYLPTFLDDFNGRFAVVPREPSDAHRPLLPQDDLGRILTPLRTQSLN